MDTLTWYYIMMMVLIVTIGLVVITKTLIGFVSRERDANRAFELDKMKVHGRLGYADEVES